MKTMIRRVGNSQGVLIPKPLIAQIGLHDEVEMTIERDAIVLRKPRTSSREGWAAAARAVGAAGGDELAWPEFANADDAELKW
jgi:antitoxin MazE